MRFPMSFRRRLRVRIRRGNLELVLLISFALRPTRRFPRVPSPRPNDSLAPARSALAGLRLRPDSFRRFPSGSSPPGRGGNWVTRLGLSTLCNSIQREQSSIFVHLLTSVATGEGGGLAVTNAV